MKTRPRSGSLAIILTLGVAAVLVHAGCGRSGGPWSPEAPEAPEVSPLEVTYYYLPG